MAAAWHVEYQSVSWDPTSEISDVFIKNSDKRISDLLHFPGDSEESGQPFQAKPSDEPSQGLPTACVPTHQL